MQDASELGEQKDMCLSISEVSELTGITPSNLRFFHLVRQGNSTLRERYRMLQEGHQAMKTRIRELKKCLKYSKIKMEYIGQCCEAYDKGEPLPQVNPEWMDSFLKQKI